MVVGDHQTLRRDEAGGAAAEGRRRAHRVAGQVGQLLGTASGRPSAAGRRFPAAAAAPTCLQRHGRPSQPEAGDDGKCKQVRAHGAAPGSGTFDCSPPPCPGPNPEVMGLLLLCHAHVGRAHGNRPEGAWSPWTGPLAPWAGRMRLAGWAGRPTPVLPCAQDSAHEQGAIEHHGWAFACPGQGDHAPFPGSGRRRCSQHVRNARRRMPFVPPKHPQRNMGIPSGTL